MIKYENVTMTPLRVENADFHLRKGQIMFLSVNNFIENAILCSAGKALKLKLNYNNWITDSDLLLKGSF